MREVTKDEAEEIISANRHNELKSVLKQIAFYLSSEKNEKKAKEVVDEIRKQSQNIEHFFKSIELNQNSKELVSSSSFNKMREDILASNERLVKTIENRLLPDTFDLIRNNGVTQSVKVNYKEASKIVKKYS